MLINNSTTDKYPKTLFIRNTEGGMIWQVYHVHTIKEAEKLAFNATTNGFQDCQLLEHQKTTEETWPDWRETSENIIDK